MNLTLKNIPEDVYSLLKRNAQERGRSLNAQIISLLSSEAAELQRRRKMRESRKQLDRFVASMPPVEDSAKLIREERER